MPRAARVIAALGIFLGLSFSQTAAATKQRQAGTARLLPGVNGVPELKTVPGAFGGVALSASALPVSAPARAALDARQADQAREFKPATAALQRNAELVQALAPANSSRIGDEQAHTLGARLFGTQPFGSALGTAAGPQDPVDGNDGRSTNPLDKGNGKGEDERAGVKTPQEEPARLVQTPWNDFKNYQRLWWQNMWFYVVTNIRVKYNEAKMHRQKLLDAGEVPAVSKPRLFFSHMRVMGQTGWFYIMGFGALEDGPVAAEARASFRHYFDGPGIDQKTIAAFDRFVDRAKEYNKEKRAPSNYRKLLRDAMIKSSTMPAAKIAGYLDSLYPDAARATDYQGQSADALLKRFKEIVMEELNAQQSGRGKIVAVILIGSFATGAATPKSDFDGEVITTDGSAERVNGFVAKVVGRWATEGRQARNPITFHMFPFTLSRRLIRRIHDAPYLVFSPDPRIERELAMRDGEPFAFKQDHQWHWWSHPLRQLQRWTVFGTSFLPAPKKKPLSNP